MPTPWALLAFISCVTGVTLLSTNQDLGLSTSQGHLPEHPQIHVST